MVEGKYVTVRMLGSGSSGVVEEVRRVDRSGPNLAIKRVHELVARDEEAVRRFKREVRILSDLNHPGMIEILDADLACDRPWFAMPLASTSLDRVIIPGSGLSEDRIQVLFDQVLDAMSYAHARGVIHRDLKPHNVLMLDGRAVITDFGLGRQFDSESTTLTVTGGQGGTYGYVAPEQWTGLHEVDERADVYALGSLLFEMAAGMNPIAISHKTMPPQFAYVINRCRTQEPEGRYSSVDELRTDFNQMWIPDVDLTPAIERARDLLEVAADDPDARRNLINVYIHNPSDEDLYQSTVPQWSDELLSALNEHEAGALATILERFDRWVSANLDFAFVDVVADFLARVYRVSADPEVRSRALTRILLTGAFHFRWHAGGVFADLAKLARNADALAVRRILLENPEAATWVANWVRAEGAAPAILEALNQSEDG